MCIMLFLQACQQNLTFEICKTYTNCFWLADSEGVFWPVLIIATLATVVGSQAIISATFSVISQCRALGCFPRVKIIHTSNNIYGQIYIPEVNWILLLLCLAITVGFRDTHMIGNAYGKIFLISICFSFMIKYMCLWLSSLICTRLPIDSHVNMIGTLVMILTGYYHQKDMQPSAGLWFLVKDLI